MTVTVKMNRQGVDALLKSPDVAAELNRRARRIASAAGPGMEVRSSIGRTRARAVVITSTPEARAAEATDRRLSAALWSGR